MINIGKLKVKKILMAHFRVGKTDGVSLEIAAWSQIWQKLGFKVELCAGPVSVGAGYVIANLEQQLNPAVYRIDEDAFAGFKHFKNEQEFADKFFKVQKNLKSEFEKVVKASRPDFIVISNIFSVGENLPAAGALSSVLEKYKIHTILVHHDFYWENPRYATPSCRLVSDQLDKFFPPDFAFIKHCTINSIGAGELKKRKNIDSLPMPDTLDFANFHGRKKPECFKFLKKAGVRQEDLVVLQATRIVRRKNIELAIDLVSEISPQIGKLGKKRAVLLLAGYAEKRDLWYLDALFRYAKSKNVRLIHLNGVFGRHCGLMDVYPFADVVTFPSEYEAFGNQFLEAVYHKKPVVIFEYPVFAKDIKPLGFEVISLGNKISFDQKSGLVKLPPSLVKAAAAGIISWLSNKPNLKKITERNFELAENNYSYEKTSERWKKLLV